MSARHPANAELAKLVSGRLDRISSPDELSRLSRGLVALAKYPKRIASQAELRRLDGFLSMDLSFVAHLLPARTAADDAAQVSTEHSFYGKASASAIRELEDLAAATTASLESSAQHSAWPGLESGSGAGAVVSGSGRSSSKPAKAKAKPSQSPPASASPPSSSSSGAVILLHDDDDDQSASARRSPRRAAAVSAPPAAAPSQKGQHAQDSAAAVAVARAPATAAAKAAPSSVEISLMGDTESEGEEDTPLAVRLAHKLAGGGRAATATGAGGKPPLPVPSSSSQHANSSSAAASAGARPAVPSASQGSVASATSAASGSSSTRIPLVRSHSMPASFTTATAAATAASGGGHKVKALDSPSRKQQRSIAELMQPVAAATAAAAASSHSGSSSSGGGGSGSGAAATGSDAADTWCCADCGRTYAAVAEDASLAWVVKAPGRLALAQSAVAAASASASASSSGNAAVCPYAASSPAHICSLDSANWQVVLLLDNREVRSQKDRGYIQAKLQAAGVACEVRQLPLGDMLWVARRKRGSLLKRTAEAAALGAAAGGGAGGGAGGATKKRKKADGTAALQRAASLPAVTPAKAGGADGSGVSLFASPGADGSDATGLGEYPRQHEYLLNFIAERKCLHDLAASIVDGRYAEQKLRLNSTGLRVTYIVEGDPARIGESTAYGAGAIQTKHIVGAMANTTVMSGFRVVNTFTLDATCEFLANMHAAVEHSFATGALCQAWLHSSAGLPPLLPTERHMVGDPSRIGTVPGAAATSSSSNAICAVPPSSPQCSQLCLNDKCLLFGRSGLPPHVRNYAEWAASASKPRALTALHVFGLALRQIHGLSADRAQAVLERYPTASALFAAYARLASPQHEGPAMLKNMTVPNQSTALGPSVSQRIYDLFYGSSTAYPGGGAGGAGGAGDDEEDDSSSEDGGDAGGNDGEGAATQSSKRGGSAAQGGGRGGGWARGGSGGYWRGGQRFRGRGRGSGSGSGVYGQGYGYGQNPTGYGFDEAGGFGGF